MSNAHKYKRPTLLIHPCIEGDLNGTAGCTGFLVRIELLEQGLFLDFGPASTIGFYGHEIISTLQIRTATKYCTWMSMYVRQRGMFYGKGYDLRTYEPLKHTKNKIVMGDLNGSPIYAQPIKTWSKRGLEQDAEVWEAPVRPMEVTKHGRYQCQRQTCICCYKNTP